MRFWVSSALCGHTPHTECICWDKTVSSYGGKSVHCAQRIHLALNANRRRRDSPRDIASRVMDYTEEGSFIRRYAVCCTPHKCTNNLQTLKQTRGPLHCAQSVCTNALYWLLGKNLFLQKLNVAPHKHDFRAWYVCNVIRFAFRLSRIQVCAKAYINSTTARNVKA